MMKNLHSAILAVIVLLAIGCKKEDIYERPPWLAGKLFSQIESRPELSTFTRCVQLIGYDSVINVSGSYTVFAPSDEAFQVFFDEHPVYNTVEDIPLEELARIVKFHIVQNPWSVDQLRKLDVYGWIDSLDLNNDEPRGFKRETILREENTKYGIKEVSQSVAGRKLIMLDTLESAWHRRQATDSRKYAPVFYQEYFDIYKLEPEDYAYYFGRPFSSDGLYFVNARILTPDIFAENGFVHVIDRVVQPLQNAYQLMDNPTGPYSYSDFLDLVNTFPVLTYNENKTLDQPGADLGHQVDSLFDITYPNLTFNVVNERTQAPKGATGLPSNVTIRYQHGLAAPTDEALQALVDEYLVGPNRWGSLAQAPVHIRRMVVNSQMASGPLYPSNFSRGFYNGENDWTIINETDILEKKFGSNCTFIGVSKMTVPRAFSSVTGPVYLRRGYSRIMYTIEESGLLSALKRQNMNYMFFVENDANLAVDSSLVVNYNPQLDRYQFAIYNIVGTTNTLKNTTITDLRNIILNHIAVEQPTGQSRKEFLRNLAGNYIVVNNETGEYRGSAPSTFGYQGPQVLVYPQQIGEDADNGKTFDITNWFNFSSGSFYNIISSTYPRFHKLLDSAGLVNRTNFTYNFMSADENYTVFAPNNAALAAYNYKALSIEQLKKFLMMHFVQGSLIFTDGRMSAGYYESARIDEKSTQYSRIYTKFYLTPQPDIIHFRAKDGTTYLSVTESSQTNRMVARTLNAQAATTIPTLVTNGVIHEIDEVLLYSVMDTE